MLNPRLDPAVLEPLVGQLGPASPDGLDLIARRPESLRIAVGVRPNFGLTQTWQSFSEKDAKLWLSNRATYKQSSRRGESTVKAALNG